MMDINLLPVPQRKQISLSSVEINIPKRWLLGLGGSVLILILCTSLMLGLFLLVKSTILVSQKAIWAQMGSERKELEDVQSQSNKIHQDKSLLTGGLTSKYTGWAKRLDMINDSVIKGVWLKSLSFDGQTLLIDGYLISKNQNELATINGLVDNLKKEPSFAADFPTIDISNVAKEKRGLVEVTKFTVTARSQ